MVIGGVLGEPYSFVDEVNRMRELYMVFQTALR